MSGVWEETSNLWQKPQNRVAKSAFHVSRATLWGKDDESKLYDYQLFLRLWVSFLFCSTEKVVGGVETLI